MCFGFSKHKYIVWGVLRKWERKLIPKAPPIKKWSSHRRDFFFDSFLFDWVIFYELTNECDNSSANEILGGGLYYVFMSKYSVDWIQMICYVRNTGNQKSASDLFSAGPHNTFLLRKSYIQFVNQHSLNV